MGICDAHSRQGACVTVHFSSIMLLELLQLGDLTGVHLLLDL
jgi:hypothetical protein